MGPVPFRLFIEQAYVAVLLPYNGWLSERSFRIALNGVPKEWLWMHLAPTEAAFWEDCAVWPAMLGSVLERADAMMSELQLRDESKSM